MSKVYEMITNEIINGLKEGYKPWKRPWRRAGQHNAVTGRDYSGINEMLLEMHAHQCFYPHSGWVTFKQAAKAGMPVMKGEKGVKITYFSFIKKKETTDAGKEIEVEVPILRYYTVFNLIQLEADDEKLDKYLPHEPIDHDGRLQAAEDALTALLLRHQVVVEDASKAAFIPSRDMIKMPPKASFKKLEDYYGTIFHELVHWSGAKTRLDRQFGKRFGDEAYAFEELVAEIGASFMCARLGLPYDGQHTSYIGGWLKVLGGDKFAIFTAAKHAKIAVNMLLGEDANKGVEDVA